MDIFRDITMIDFLAEISFLLIGSIIIGLIYWYYRKWVDKNEL